MNLEILSLFSLIIVLVYVLFKSADLIEDGFVYLAKRLGISEFFIGFLILAIVSQSPEFSIAINSNTSIPQLSIGNLMGGSLILLTLIIGISAIKFGNIEFKGKFKQPDVVVGLGMILFAVFFLLDKELSIVESIVLAGSYIFYLIFIYEKFRVRKILRRTSNEQVQINVVLKMIAKSVFGIILILISSALIVDVVIEIGERVNVSEALIGLVVLAVGTNIPEIAILIRAKTVSHRKLAMGNFMGAAVINILILGVLGLTARGVILEDKDFLTLIPVLMLLALTIVLLTIFSWTGHKITKEEGVVLILVYVSLLVSELVILLLNGEIA